MHFPSHCVFSHIFVSATCGQARCRQGVCMPRSAHPSSTLCCLALHSVALQSAAITPLLQLHRDAFSPTLPLLYRPPQQPAPDDLLALVREEARKCSLSRLRNLVKKQDPSVPWYAFSRKRLEEWLVDHCPISVFGVIENHRCAYELCRTPTRSSGGWFTIKTSTRAGGRDWSMCVAAF